MLSQLTKVTPALRSSNMWAWVTRVGLCDVPREGLVLAPKRPHLVATRHWLQAARWNLSFRSMLSFQQRNRPDWQLLEKPLGVMPARLFLLTWEGDMPNDKPLKPDDFPVDVEGEELVTAGGQANRQGENASDRRGYRGPSQRRRLPQRAGQMVGLI